MATMQEHCENLLRNDYTLMFGEPENRFEEFSEFSKNMTFSICIDNRVNV
ncbi:MAG: hypothetical protein ACUZ8O_12100 [Candidatus Anammoxibacter sp.]